MCKASRIEANEPATDGQKTVIGKVGTGKHAYGALHRPGEATAICVICVQTSQVLTLSAIPPKLQKKFGIGQSVVATFIEMPGEYEDDRLTFTNRDGVEKNVPFVAFADQGVQAYVGALDLAHDAPSIETKPALVVATGVLATHDGNRAVA